MASTIIREYDGKIKKKIKSNYFMVRLEVDHRAGQFSLPHLGITKTQNNRTKT